MSAPPWRIRPFAHSDVPGVVALMNSVSEAYNLQESVSEEQLRTWLTAPRSEPERQRVVVEGLSLAGLPPHVPAGYGNVRLEEDAEAGERIYMANFFVHKAAEGLGLERAIASRLIEIARGYEAEPGIDPTAKAIFKGWSLEPQHNKRATWLGLGLQEVRQFWTMARNLHDPIDEPAPIEGVYIRPYSYPRDGEGARASFNSSFEDHWDHHPIGQDDWEHWMSQGTVRHDLSLLAEVEAAPGTFAGFCIITLDEADNKRRNVCEGWIDLLGTIRGWRGIGLGRALLMHGLHSLKTAGMDTALLGVDSQSLTGANKLYESVGFRIRLREFGYAAPLEELGKA